MVNEIQNQQDIEQTYRPEQIDPGDSYQICNLVRAAAKQLSERKENTEPISYKVAQIADFPQEAARLKALEQEQLDSLRRGKEWKRKPSSLFHPGMVHPGTLLEMIDYNPATVLTPGRRGGTFLCRCLGRGGIIPGEPICDKRIIVSYDAMYRASIYSCGCTEKPRALAYDDKGRLYGVTFGRIITTGYVNQWTDFEHIIGWNVMCTECGNEEFVARAPGYTYETRLKSVGKKRCPKCGYRTKNKDERRGRPMGLSIPCFWGCGATLCASNIQKHFSYCPKRPVAVESGKS